MVIKSTQRKKGNQAISNYFDKLHAELDEMRLFTGASCRKVCVSRSGARIRPDSEGVKD